MKLNYHVFSAKAFDAVYEALENSEVAQTATMYAGTLFVKCNAYSAAKIETALIKHLECGVIVCRVGPEYAFDFV
jgi:hypothetical protein